MPSIAISTDRVDADTVTRPQRWNVRDIQHFMIVFGLLSTVFDLLTFVILLEVFDASEATFQTGWFVVSLLTELAVVLVLRTHGRWYRSAPSRLLLGLTVAVAAATLAIPCLRPLAAAFGRAAIGWADGYRARNRFELRPCNGNRQAALFLADWRSRTGALIWVKAER